jgi:hypothetical protein
MRFSKGLSVGVAGLAVAALVGCSGSSSAPAPYPGSTSAGPSSAAPAMTEPITAQTGPAEPETRAGVRAAAAHFYRLYSTSQFAASWDLLAPTAQRAIPEAVWVSVHDGCLPASASEPRVIKSVIVFGSAAIVTETIAGASKRGKAEDVFNYFDGHWGYSPNDLSIYGHGSVAADVAAAKSAGFCTSRKASPL